MSRNKQPENSSLTPLQKQAVLVCLLCALAVLLTAGITLTILSRGKATPELPAESVVEVEPGEDLSEHYQIDNTSSALLPETADAGEDYLSQTLFLGDSNTVRLYNNGLISLQQFCAKEGIGTQAALSEGIVTFKNDSAHYTIAQAVAKMKPRRVVITLGTNDTGMEVQDFIGNYTALLQAIQAAYPYTDIIVNTVPPVPANHSNYPSMDQAKIDDFNMALLTMCEQLGVRFLNSAEALKDASGYGQADYYTSGDIHLKSSGLKAVLTYLRTHAYVTEDRRPDTTGIPTRTLEYSSNPSSAVPAPSSSEASSEPESSSAAVLYEARYQVDKAGGGTLTCEDDAGKTSLRYSVTDAAQTISVTAVPAEGYVFVKWSDGVTGKTRTDKNFKQNLDVTAMFAAASVHISGENRGTSYVFKATLKGKYSSAENLRWYANSAEVKEAAGQTTVTVPADLVTPNETYKIYAVLSYNESSVTSNALVLTVSGEPSPAPDSSSSSASASSASSGASSSSSSSAASSGASSGSTSSASSGAGSSGSSSSEASSSSGSADSASTSHSTASGSSSASASASESQAASSGSASHAESAASSKEQPAEKSETSSAASLSGSASSSEASASKEATAESKAE